MIEPENVARFRQLAQGLADTYAAKNKMYNDSFGESVRRYGPVAAITRISDKFRRAENLLVFNKGEIAYEGIEDTLLDLAAYALMTIIAIK